MFLQQMKLFLLSLLLLSVNAFRTKTFSTRFISKALSVVPLEIKGKVDPKKKWDVKFVLNGVEKVASVSETTSLLEAAEELYKDAPYSCRNGVCTTCSAKITTGRSNIVLAVHGLGEPILNLDYVCSCQAFPIGAGITVQLGAYDDVYEIQYGQYEKSYQKTALTGTWDEKQKKYI
jgi:ferredoxin